MIPAGFEYYAPRSVADAVKLLSELGPEAKLLAVHHHSAQATFLRRFKLRETRVHANYRTAIPRNPLRERTVAATEIKDQFSRPRVQQL